jgi:hypothetical protein
VSILTGFILANGAPDYGDGIILANVPIEAWRHVSFASLQPGRLQQPSQRVRRAAVEVEVFGIDVGVVQTDFLFEL